ncbi:MAG: carboxypeptidase regulatory-like domain-containing protein [Lewinellaceae bacterium]|nr:carboxypeptidase regulatory-like domain-containing protein [Lewinellaceae bacterium]
MTTQPLRFGMKAAVTVFFAVMHLTAMWSQQATISGRITTLFGQGLEETTIEVTGASGTSYFDLTDADGNYAVSVPTGRYLYGQAIQGYQSTLRRKHL